jgi:hypothetical protein
VISFLFGVGHKFIVYWIRMLCVSRLGAPNTGTIDKF